MDSTRVSLLTQAGTGSADAWVELVRVYEPQVYGWLRKHGVAHHDAEELTQDVLSVVVNELSDFRHSGNTGAFRQWLRQITIYRAKGFWRSGKIRLSATGETRFIEMLNQLSDESSTLSREWNREHDLSVLRTLLDRIESEFSATTLNAFRRQVFDGQKAETVAEALNLSISATYSAKSRVLRKLRRLAEGLVDEIRLE